MFVIISYFECKKLKMRTISHFIGKNCIYLKINQNDFEVLEYQLLSDATVDCICGTWVILS